MSLSLTVIDMHLMNVDGDIKDHVYSRSRCAEAVP